MAWVYNKNFLTPHMARLVTWYWLQRLNLHFKTYSSQFLCKFYYGVGQLCMLSSVFIICFMAADRYFQIKSAPRVRKRSNQFYQIGSLICWMLSIGLTFPGLVWEFFIQGGKKLSRTLIIPIRLICQKIMWQPFPNFLPVIISTKVIVTDDVIQCKVAWGSLTRSDCDELRLTQTEIDLCYPNRDEKLSRCDIYHPTSERSYWLITGLS